VNTFTTRSRGLLASGLTVVLLAGCATPGPHEPPPAATTAPRPEIYDPRADGEGQLAVGLARAQREGKRVLLNLGANWCGDSQAMYRLLQDDRKIACEVSRHYVLVMVDVNRRDGPPRNGTLVARFGDPLARGIPVLLVLAPDGTLLNADPAERLADSDHQHPAKVLDYLRRWGRPRP
jgi:thiol:disulfide interchange protein